MEDPENNSEQLCENEAYYVSYLPVNSELDLRADIFVTNKVLVSKGQYLQHSYYVEPDYSPTSVVVRVEGKDRKSCEEKGKKLILDMLENNPQYMKRELELLEKDSDFRRRYGKENG